MAKAGYSPYDYRLPRSTAKETMDSIFSNTTLFDVITTLFKIYLVGFYVICCHEVFIAIRGRDFLEFIFALFGGLIVTGLVALISGLILFFVYASSQLLALLFVIALYVLSLGLYFAERRRRARWEWEYKHRATPSPRDDSLCAYCDAFISGDGALTHQPSCSRRRWHSR